MKKLLLAACAVVALAACATGGPLDPGQPLELPVSKELPPTAQEAQRLIREAHLSIAAAAGVIGPNASAGVWSPEQAQGYLDRLADTRTKLLIARRYMTDLNYDAALAEAKLLQSVLLVLHRELAEQAAKAQAPGGTK